MALSISAPTRNGEQEDVNWKELKQEVIRKLDIRKEYEVMGVRLVRQSADEKGFIPCYGIRDDGNTDTNPSACINVRKGFYLDKGVSDQSINFFQFSVNHGRFGSWNEAFKHYADKVGVEIGKVVKTHKGWIVEEAYEYTEADGEVKYRVRRLIQPTGKKAFDQQKWNGDRWEGGAGCMDGIDPLPYRFPDLMESRETDLILFVEGERDVERAYEVGLFATTNHTGAHNWDTTGARFVHRLPIRDYVVIPDNDDVGRRHAAKVAEALYDRLAGSDQARTIKVLSLPDVSHKGDLSDWLDGGGTVERLREMIAAAPAWEPGVVVEAPVVDHDNPDDPEGDCTIEDLAKHVSLTPWVWEGWIPSAALTLLASEAGAGKTRLMMDLHRRAYHSLSWPDDSDMNLPPGGKVIWIVADNHHEQMVLEAQSFGLFGVGAIIINTKRGEPYGGTTLVTPEQLEDLEARIRRNNPYWVVIDTITNTGDFKIQDSVDAKKQYKPLQEIAQRTKTPIICVTHTNATGKVLGRRAIEKVRVVMMFSEPDRANQPGRRKLWVEKSFAQKPAARGVTVSPGAYEYDDNPPEEAGAAEHSEGGRAAPKKQAMVALLKDALGAGAQPVTELIDLAIERGSSKPVLYAAKDMMDIEEFKMDGRRHWRLRGPFAVYREPS